jgi:hypothetical protein
MCGYIFHMSFGGMLLFENTYILNEEWKFFIDTISYRKDTNHD